jgi:DNA-binding transcriptional LysR family regulator
MPAVAERETDWDDLRIFLAAVRAGTLAGAARALRVEHTTIGRRLSSLERSLGAPVVLRGPDGIKPTPLGELIVPIAEQMERAVSTVRDHALLRRARVRLAMPSGLAGLFAPRIAELQQRHQKLSLEIMSGSRPVDLRKGEADLAIRLAPITDKDLVMRTLCETGWALYASQAYLSRRAAPRDSDDLAGHDVIGYDPSLAAVPAAGWLEARSAKANVVLRSREITDMMAAALSGVGLAVLPCIVADRETKLARLTKETIATRTVSLVYRRELKLSRELRAVIDMVVDVMRQT